jgi:predicted PurR-regulated permease PerM
MQTLVVIHLPTEQVVRAALALVGLVLGIYLLWRIQDVLFLFILAILLATTIHPLVERLRRGPFTRGTGVLAIYTAIVLAIGLPTVLLAPSFMTQTGSFVDSLPTRLDELRAMAEGIEPTPLRLLVVTALTEAVSQLRQPATTSSQAIVATGAGVAVTAIDALLVFVLAFYWIVERSTVRRSLLQALPRQHVPVVNSIWNELEETLGAWVRGQLLVMLIVGILGGAGFFLLGLPSPVVLGVLAAVGEMIPIVGPFLGFAPAVLVTLAMEPGRLPLVIGYAIIVQFIESTILVPRIMHEALGISPLTILLGIQAGAILYGLPGALLAVPVAAAVQVILTHTLGAEKEAARVPVASTPSAPLVGGSVVRDK